uniref:Lysozyme g n=1 Tax=Bostrychus sinensis TaxID=86224 RepID=A0A650FP41_9TELE|nr:g-type lysozyme [Bostrychus sinensis]QGV12790.1 g-type lysozyme [Bostrychus sinensis]
MGYENINIIKDAAGASQQTASQDRLPCKGVPASEQMAKTDLNDMKTYKKMIEEVGEEFKIDPALIAAIISRESRAGKALHDGWGDWDPARQAYNGWGLMQVDVNPNGGRHTPRGAWNSKEHLRQATGILVYFIGRICNKFGNWTEAQQLKGGIAAYNMGDGNVHSYEEVDEHTTGRDYSNDVVARAQWYKVHLFGQ